MRKLNKIQIILIIFLFLYSSATSQGTESDFYAYYTRLDFQDGNNTGKYADIVVNVGQLGKFVFSREYSYLPFWQASKTKHFVDKIIPINGDGPAERPDKINKCSYSGKYSASFSEFKCNITK